MFEEAVNYPRNSDDATTTILIGGVLGVLSVLVIPTVLVAGHLVRVLRESMDETPPVFDEWGDLLVDGLKVAVVAFAYSLLAIVVFTVTVGAAAASANFVGTDRLGAAFAVGDLRAVLFDGDHAVGWLVALVLMLVAGVVAAALDVIPFLGFVAGAFVIFYASVAATYVYGPAFDAARSPTGQSESPAGRPAA